MYTSNLCVNSTITIYMAEDLSDPINGLLWWLVICIDCQTGVQCGSNCCGQRKTLCERRNARSYIYYAITISTKWLGWDSTIWECSAYVCVCVRVGRAIRTVASFPSCGSRRHAHLFAPTNIKTPLCISGTHFTEELSRWEHIERERERRAGSSGDCQVAAMAGNPLIMAQTGKKQQSTLSTRQRLSNGTLHRYFLKEEQRGKLSSHTTVAPLCVWKKRKTK